MNATIESESVATLELTDDAVPVAIDALGFGRRAIGPSSDVSRSDYSETIRKLNVNGGEIEVTSEELTVLWDAAVRYQEDAVGRGNTGAGFERFTAALVVADNELEQAARAEGESDLDLAGNGEMHVPGDDAVILPDGGEEQPEREPVLMDSRPPVCPNDSELLEPVDDENVRCPECGYARLVLDREGGSSGREIDRRILGSGDSESCEDPVPDGGRKRGELPDRFKEARQRRRKDRERNERILPDGGEVLESREGGSEGGSGDRERVSMPSEDRVDRVMLGLGLYGNVTRSGLVEVSIEDDAEIVRRALRRAHRNGYLMLDSRRVSGGERRIRFQPAEESEFEPPEGAERRLMTDGGQPTEEPPRWVDWRNIKEAPGEVE